MKATSYFNRQVTDYDGNNSNQKYREDMITYIGRVKTRYKFNTQNTLTLRGTYGYTKYGNNYDYTPELNYKSSMREVEAEIMSENKGVKFLGSNDITFGFKNIFRQNLTSSNGTDSYSVQQLYLTDARSLAKKLTAYLILKGETDNLGHRRSYEFLPSLKLNYNVGKTGNIAIIYGRNVNRPNANQLNADTLWLSDYNLQVGNRSLKTQHSDNVRLSYSTQIKKSYLTLAAGYDYVDDMISPVYMDGNNISVTTFENIGHSNIASLSASLSEKFCKGRMNVKVSASGFYQTYSLKPLYADKVLVKPVNGYSYSINFNWSYLTTKSWQYSLDFNYRPKTYNLNTVNHSHPMVQASIAKSLLKNKLNISINVLNGFAWFGERRTDYNYRNTIQKSWNKNHYENISINLSYILGNPFMSRKVATGTKTSDVDFSKPKQ